MEESTKANPQACTGEEMSGAELMGLVRLIESLCATFWAVWFKLFSFLFSLTVLLGAANE